MTNALHNALYIVALSARDRYACLMNCYAMKMTFYNTCIKGPDHTYKVYGPNILNTSGQIS